MLQSVHLENYKCFDNLDLEFRNMTVFAGVNGSGKSSIIQALLLLRQTHIDKSANLSKELLLKGSYVNLISANAIRNFMSDREDVVIAANEKGLNSVVFTMPSMIRDDISSTTTVEGPLDEFVEKSNLMDTNFVYLYADRQMPQVDYDIKERDIVGASRIGNIHGNLTAAFLNECGNVKTISIDGMRHSKAENQTVIANVAAWMQYIMDYDLKVKAEMSASGKRIDLSYLATVKGNDIQISPMNVAFGNSYLLPVVVGILTAPSGSLFIVENPEAHLHPRAQLRVAEMLARAANLGVQIIVETHSDHFLNSLRYNVYKDIIHTSNFVAYYKNSADDVFEKVECGRNGDYLNDGFPDGFFDASLNILTEMQ